MSHMSESLKPDLISVYLDAVAHLIDDGSGLDRSDGIPVVSRCYPLDGVVHDASDIVGADGVLGDKVVDKPHQDSAVG